MTTRDPRLQDNLCSLLYPHLLFTHSLISWDNNNLISYDLKLQLKIIFVSFLSFLMMSGI